jgi:hypothetical protein
MPTWESDRLAEEARDARVRREERGRAAGLALDAAERAGDRPEIQAILRRLAEDILGAAGVAAPEATRLGTGDVAGGATTAEGGGHGGRT